MTEYIDRKELIREIISNMALFMGTPDDVQRHDEQCNYAISCIESAKAVDVVPVVHGRWTITKEYNDIIDMVVVRYTCSACGEYKPNVAALSQTSYCPYCGAKMDGGRGNEK